VQRDAGKEDEAATAVAPEPGTPVVTKLMFAPVKVVSRRIAPRVSKKIFTRLWSIVGGDEPPPQPQERQDSVAKLALALALEGACAAIVTGLLDQASRRKFARVTGRWPGRRSR